MFLNFSAYQRSVVYLVVMVGLMWWSSSNLISRGARAQDDAAGPSAPSATPEPTPESKPAPPAAPPNNSLNVLSLAINGGIFMIPLFGLSILTATMTVERFIGLRRLKVLPDPLVAELGQLGGAQGGFDPRKAYRICQQYPSAAARVVRAMLLKVGRPLSEVEHTVKEVSDREATRMYTNVRWLNLCSGISTLIGLLGTVQGMILAFHKLTLIGPGENKATALAEGIYVALVTTFAGLCIAIPAGAFAHYFEGRIQAFFHEIDEMVFNLLPQVERYEGRVRFSRGDEEGTTPPAAPQPAGSPAAGS